MGVSHKVISFVLCLCWGSSADWGRTGKFVFLSLGDQAEWEVVRTEAVSVGHRANRCGLQTCHPPGSLQPRLPSVADDNLTFYYCHLGSCLLTPPHTPPFQQNPRSLRAGTMSHSPHSRPPPILAHNEVSQMFVGVAIPEQSVHGKVS